jgi:hypothetical protein
MRIKNVIRENLSNPHIEKKAWKKRFTKRP